MAFTIFNSADTGASNLTGQVGSLTTILDEVLCFKRAFTTSDDISFTDNSVEGRLDGGTPFNLLLTNVTAARLYVGSQRPFGRCRFNLATLATGGTWVVEYWNGSAWTALTVVDGTAGFTASGVITWTVPGSWATTAVNSVTCYWVRVRASATPSVNPTVNSLTVLDWLVAFSGTNIRAYRSQVGVRHYLYVDDNTASWTGGARDASISASETMSSISTGTNPYPTNAQMAIGVGPYAAAGSLIARKSNTADGTVRAWFIYADARTIYMYSASGDVAGRYHGWQFGEFTPLLVGDLYSSCIRGRPVSQSAYSVQFNDYDGLMNGDRATNGNLLWCARNVLGLGQSVACCMDVSPVRVALYTTPNPFMGVSPTTQCLPFPNPGDTGIYVAPIYIFDQTSTPPLGIRGMMRGQWSQGHNIANMGDQNVMNGGGNLSNRTFQVVKSLPNLGCAVMETSDTMLPA